MDSSQENKLPQAEQAYVSREKITLYLLNLEHPDGGSKARFFMHEGFTLARWDELADALLEHARTHAVAKTQPIEQGLLYVIEGTLHTPSGKRPNVRSVWLKEPDEPPRLVTAYPIGG